MAWVYQQATGMLFLNTVFVGNGYSGHGSGLNNPSAQSQQNIGPLPVGTYTIGAPHIPIDHLGPLALPLYPVASNQMFGRFGFFIHGDNQYDNKSASDGCIIMSPSIRAQVSSSGDTVLNVVSGVSNQQAGGVPMLSALAAMPIANVSFHDAPPNAYPELPVLDYQQTSVSMTTVIDAINASNYPVEVKRTSYVVFRNESGNGQSGVNNNYGGVQADGGRWPSEPAEGFAGTVIAPENATHLRRRFLTFRTFEGFLDFLMGRLQDRGLYIGGEIHHIATMNVKTEDDLVRAYYKEWVEGSAAAEPDAGTKVSFLSMYHQSKALIT